MVLAAAPAFARRDFLRVAGLAALGAGVVPHSAIAQTMPDLMPRVRAMVEKWVGPGRFPGMVVSLGLKDRESHYVARGSEGFTDFDAVSADTLYRLYSMTKPVTGMAAMILIDEGRLALDQPVSDVLPKFAKMQVQKTYDGSLTDLVPAKSAITIRQLLTHTSGLGYTIIQKGPIKAAMEDAGLIAGVISRKPVPGFDRGKPVRSLSLFADRLAEMPLVHQPDTKWEYSLGLDLMGRIIEVVSGQPFDQFLKERIFEPCGMTSTGFHVPASAAHRIATNYAAIGGVLAPLDPGDTSVYLDPPPFPFGGSGLIGSPRDYDCFLRMLGEFGTVGGKRVMSEKAVRLGTSDLLPAHIDTRNTFAMGGGFGAGGRVGRGPEAGIFGWGGAAGTVGTVDMNSGLRSGLYVQFMPPDAVPLLTEYQQALRADALALLEKRT